MRAGVALGSNVGDRLAKLRQAREGLGQLAADAQLRASPVYETEPVGCADDDPPFLNAVIELEFEGWPMQLLTKLRDLESELGRDRTSTRNAPRTIDLDLLYFGDSAEFEVESSALTLPHPRMHERRFVLQPLADIRPDLILPKQPVTVAELLARLPESPRVVRAAVQW